ncbi:Trans-aconitate methyltransferase [Gammaproteobacteria bacterium]
MSQANDWLPSGWRTILNRWPIGIALLVQLVTLFLITLPLVLSTVHTGISIPPAAIPLLQGMVAAGITAVLPLARWWILLQALFPTAVVVGLVVRLSPLIWLGAFAVIWLINRNAVSERVPIYLSGRSASQILSTLLPSGPFRFVDLGCGPGGLLARLADIHPQGCFDGVESAPLPWLMARLRLARRSNCRIWWGNFWALPLGEYDVVYCFLSPAPMARLWTKARAELRPGSLFVSNTFAIPNAPSPDHVLELSDLSGPLYVWRI